MEETSKTERLKYKMVSIGIMNEQINLRLPKKVLVTARAYSEKHGYASLQEFIKETVREKLFEEAEMRLVRKLALLSEKKGLYGTEKELFRKLGNV